MLRPPRTASISSPARRCCKGALELADGGGARAAAPRASARRNRELSAASGTGAGGLRARLRTMPPDQRKASILRTFREADGDKELAKWHRAGRAATAASAQW